jgi:sulfate adenylyltransferase subunit 1 (EFTu-like GTPase family)
MSLLGEVEKHAAVALAERSVLRFITAGSVDDGKSTLIGRLLHDTHAIMEDQFAAVKRASDKRGALETDLSLLTDGLEAEREQGITIDVAYRYFTTPRRKFIIADTPGHEQYTRNMVTGASTADAAIILLDARGRARAIQAPLAAGESAGYTPHHRGGEQDGCGGLQPQRVRVGESGL